MNNKFYKLILIMLVCCLISEHSIAGPRNKFGTLAAPELLIPVGSIGTSLQGSNIASVTGIDAMYWNPAGLSQIKSKTGEAMFSHMNYIADINMQYVSGIVKVGTLGYIGASLRSLNFGEEIVTTEYSPEGTGETFSPIYITGSLSFAKAMTEKIHFGVNIKYISEQIADVSATGFAFDFGLQYLAGQSGLRFGIALKNLGSSMKFDGPGLDRQFTENEITTVRRVNLQEFDLPTNLEVGVSYSTQFGNNNNLTFSSAFQSSSLSSDEYKLGIEYSYNNFFYLRGSYNYYADISTDESLFGPSFGAGLKHNFGNLLIGFNYAYRVINESAFNSTNQFFTLDIGF